MTETIEVDFDEPLDVDFQTPGIVLRDFQEEAMAAVALGWQTFTRQLLDMATGVGKTTIFSAIAAKRWRHGQRRTLVLENRDALVRQTAKRIADETGLQVDIEMAGERAGPFAPIVVASVPTLCRTARLIGFADDHFSLVVPDEAHHSCSASYRKVCNYFHYGAAALADDWEAPPDGTYTPKACILGVTATPDIGERRSLGEIYQSVAYTYQLLQAVRDGWLIQPVAVMEPLAVDFKGLRATRTPNGSDYNPTQVAERLVPVIEALAKLIVRLAGARKTMAFMPSINTASMLAEAINRNGLRAIFVSGECLDRDEKTDEFVRHGRGIVLCTAALYVEGFDVPDVDCVFAGITKSRSYYRQKIGRATRPLKGVLDGCQTAAERLAAIAASDKPDFLIIDPFCKCTDIELCDSYDLFAEKPEVKARMKSLGPPTEETAREAERDFVKALEKEARKHARKAARTIDPLAWAVSLGDAALKDYVPQSGWEGAPPTTGQLEFIRRQGMATEGITSKGLASKIIGRLMTRIQLKLASPAQLEFLHKLGFDDQQCATLTMREASDLLDRRVAKKSGE